VGVGDLYHALWRHKLFIVVMTALLASAVWFLTSRQTKIYEASTLVRVDQAVVDPSELRGALEAGERLVRTYAIIAETERIAADVFAQLGGEVPRAEIAKVSAEPGEEVELLWITAQSPNPERAQLIANAVPRALQNYIRESRRFQVPTTSADPDDPTLAPEQTVIARERVDVVNQASVPVKPAYPDLKLNLALAVSLGVIFNGALALLIVLVSDRWRDADELERLTGRPVLASVPNLQLNAPAQIEATREARRPQTRAAEKGAHG
jgi:succinoglycan biosynthesis transport protein ExoP